MRGDAYVDSSAYLEATPSAAVVEEIKPDDKVTQVVQPEKPVEPSGIEEEKEEEEEEVREREGMGTAQQWKVRCWMWRGVRRGVRRRNQRPRRNRRRRGGRRGKIVTQVNVHKFGVSLQMFELTSFQFIPLHCYFAGGEL